MQLDSLDFYREHARGYPQLSHEFAHLGHGASLPSRGRSPENECEGPAGWG